MKSLALLVLAAIVATAGGFSLAPAARPSRRHAVASGRVRMQVDYDDEARTGETPAGEEPAKKKYSIEEEMAGFNFLGIKLDANTPTGALGASVIVTALFGIFLELIKFIDPKGCSVFDQC